MYITEINSQNQSSFLFGLKVELILLLGIFYFYVKSFFWLSNGKSLYYIWQFVNTITK